MIVGYEKKSLFVTAETGSPVQGVCQFREIWGKAVEIVL